MYFTLAMDGTVRSVNRFGAEQLGYRVEELIGHSVLGLFHEQDKEAVAASLSECLATPAITRYWEFRKVGKDGNIIWVRETVRVDQSSAEEPIVLVTCEDITEHKRAEDESRERILQASAMQTALLKLAHLDDTRPTFSTVLPQVTSIVADMLAVERVSLWLLSEDQTEFGLPESVSARSGCPFCRQPARGIELSALFCRAQKDTQDVRRFTR